METTERKPAGWGRIVGVAVLLPVLYLASIGPAVWVVVRSGARPTMLRLAEVYFVPMRAIMDVSPRFARLIENYVAWSIPKIAESSLTPTPPPAP